jgi:hypothetical protein
MAVIDRLSMTTSAQGTFQVKLLPEGELRLALPLAQLLYPSLSETEWVAYASGRSARQTWLHRRVLVAANPSGYLHGLCTLVDGFDLRCGRTLDVDDLVVANFLDSRSVAQALLTGVEEIARSDRYQAVRVNLACSNLPHRQAVADALNSIGHVQTMARFAKPLAQPLKPIIGL